MTQPKGKQFDFNKDVIFEKFNHFRRRLEKLVDMFTTIHQFSSLEQHTHIDGLIDMIANFHQITGDVRNKGLDLLDFYSTQFDRDYLEFNVNIHDLEMNLQSFINNSFENIINTEHALNLLEQIQGILQRDTLKSDLEAKYMTIFQNYGLDMDAVQKDYEKNKVLILIFLLYESSRGVAYAETAVPAHPSNVCPQICSSVHLSSAMLHRSLATSCGLASSFVASRGRCTSLNRISPSWAPRSRAA